jgi:hypothetical protein
MPVVELVFLLIALLMVISAFFPNWNFSGGPVVTANRVIGLVIGLIILFIVYLIVVALFGAALTVGRP